MPEKWGRNPCAAWEGGTRTHEAAWRVGSEPSGVGMIRLTPPFIEKGCSPERGVTDDNTKSRSWKTEIAQAAGLAMTGAGRSLYRGPLDVTFTFYRRRPKGHFGSGRNANVLKASADRWPITKPDVLKLARAAEDALTGVVWNDDAQIVREQLVKEYGSPERVVVLVRPL